MIVAIGNAPSSGSTFLADILDSLPFAVCGPEINLFSVKGYFTDFERVKRKGFFSSPSPVIYMSRQALAIDELCLYGINQRLLNDILKEVDSFYDFSKKILELFSILRGKKCCLFFEKTPQNIHCAREFLETFSNSYFLHIVRNPIYVFKSFYKRKVPLYIAANTWIVDVCRAYELRNHPRFITIKYEDLIKSPFQKVSELLEKIGYNIDPNALEELYKNNSYRRIFSPKVKTWSYNKYGAIGNANKKELSEFDKAIAYYMSKTRITLSYAKLFDIPCIDFNILVDYYGYNSSIFLDVMKYDKGFYDRDSFLFMLRKFFSDFRRGDCTLKYLKAYLYPVEVKK